MEIINKRNYLKESGITLIALVVTIVVLLILAGVSINAIFNDNGIINKARDAQNKMDEAVKNDQTGINELSNLINSYANGTTNGENTETTTENWTQNKTTVTNGTTTYTVGDNYTYNCGVSTYKGGWKVLGAENGELLIMSTIDIGTLTLSGQDGYNTGVSQLNTMCEPYGTKVRSITVEDINRVTGYDPTNQGDGTVFGVGEFYEYGNEVTYTANESSATNGKTSAPDLEENYVHPDGRIIGINATSITVKSTCYAYYPNTLTLNSSGTTVGIATNSNAYKMLFQNADYSANCSYWLASTYVHAMDDRSLFGMRDVSTDGLIYFNDLWSSRGESGPYSLGVRAVVCL